MTTKRKNLVNHDIMRLIQNENHCNYCTNVTALAPSKIKKKEQTE